MFITINGGEANKNLCRSFLLFVSNLRNYINISVI